MTGFCIHVLNRAVKRARLFATPEDYDAFLAVLAEALQREPLRILAFCVMPNHFHLIAWPQRAGELSGFMHWMTLTHACRWHGARGTTGEGAVYQGRFKSFPIQSDEHLYRACRYVERNALRAGLVERAEDWRWGSAWHREHGDPMGLLGDGPLTHPPDWLDLVNRPETEAELAALRRSSRRGTPFGDPKWMETTAAEWGLGDTLRPRGRPSTR